MRRATLLLALVQFTNSLIGGQAAEDHTPGRVEPVGSDSKSEDPPADQTGQTQDPRAMNPADSAAATDKRGSWLFAPIPINSPAIGAGLEWAVARVFPLSKKDEISPPSTVGIGGVFTNNGSRAMVVGGRLYLKEDRYRVTAAAGTADVNLDIYGVGQAAGDAGAFVPLKTKGTGFMGEFLYGLKKHIYVGLRGQYRDLRLSLNQDEASSGTPEQIADVIDQIGADLLGQRTVSLGPRLQLDKRDNVFYPTRGGFLDANFDIFAKGLGSKFSYQYYKIGFNKYNSISKHQVIAFRGMGCAAAGDRVPIYDLCLFGAMNDLRGYPAGRYQDRRMFATQAEYRLMMPSAGFWGRFGIVAFGGVGSVAEKFGDIGFDDLLPAGGGGARFRLIKKHPINFRVDYGFGRSGHTLSVGILEAF
jgi:hypothetical protein